MSDITSLWHAAAPAPPPAQPSSSRPPSPSKSPLGRMLRSVSPAPPSRRYSDIHGDRNQSLQFDAAARGGDLPSDTFSPEPERPASRASAASANTSHSDRQTRVSGPSSIDQSAAFASHPHDAASSSRVRTMSFTQGDSYAPWGVHQSSSTLSSMSTASSASLHQQWQQQQQQQQQQRSSSPAPHYPYHPASQPQLSQAAGFAPPAPHSSAPRPYAYPHTQPQQQQLHHAAPPHIPPGSHSLPVYSAPALPQPPPCAFAQPYMPQHSQSPAPHWSPATPFAGLPSSTQSHQGHWSPAAAPMPLSSSPQIHPSNLPMQPTPPPPGSFAPSGVPFPPAAPATPGPPAGHQISASTQPAGPSPPTPANDISLGRHTPGTVRRSLPQPPGPSGVTRPPIIPPASALSRPPLSTPPPQSPQSATAASGPLPPASPSPGSVPPRSNTTTPSSGSSISRADSVRMAAEELMAKGPPRRGRGGFSRFSRSPLNPSSSSASVESTTSQGETSQPSVRSSQSEPAQVAVPPAIAKTEFNTRTSAGGSQDSAVSLVQAAEQMSLQDKGSERAAPALPEPAQPPARPSSRGPRDDVLHDRVPQTRTAPATFALAQQEVEAERRRRPLPQHDPPAISVAGPAEPAAGPQSSSTEDSGAGLAPVSEVPKIFSPPPNAAPPVPSIVFPDEDESSSTTHPSAPVIAISAPDAGPQISVTPAEVPSAPAISISGADDDDDDDGPSGPMISVSGPEDAGEGDAGPMISVSGPDDDDGAQGGMGGMTPSVSLSHAADHVPAVPQRASATTSSDAAHGRPPTNGGAGRGRGEHAGGPAQTASSVAGTICGTCNKYVAGRVVQAIGQSFHPGCFSCNYCGELLEHVAFYEHEGKAYCHFDYHELFSLRCFHCRTPIVDERFIQINDPELVQAHAHGHADKDKDGKHSTPASASAVRYYHDLHFFCANCGDPFMDPKVASSTAGSERGKIQVDAEGRVLSGSKAFVVWKGYPYCEGCHDNLHKPRCKACKRPILGDVITALKGKWHPECFVCTGCSRPFEDERVFVDAKGNGYDEECYKVWLRNQL